jgi:hypothetical protein
MLDKELQDKFLTQLKTIYFKDNDDAYNRTSFSDIPDNVFYGLFRKGNFERLSEMEVYEILVEAHIRICKNFNIEPGLVAYDINNDSKMKGSTFALYNPYFKQIIIRDINSLHSINNGLFFSENKQGENAYNLLLHETKHLVQQEKGKYIIESNSFSPNYENFVACATLLENFDELYRKQNNIKLEDELSYFYKISEWDARLFQIETYIKDLKNSKFGDESLKDNPYFMDILKQELIISSLGPAFKIDKNNFSIAVDKLINGYERNLQFFKENLDCDDAKNILNKILIVDNFKDKFKKIALSKINNLYNLYNSNLIIDKDKNLKKVLTIDNNKNVVKDENGTLSSALIRESRIK